MQLNIEYHEYDCGNPCTPSGCPGHSTDVPIGIEIDGVMFWVDGYDGGDYPRDSETIAEVQRVITKLEIELEARVIKPVRFFGVRKRLNQIINWINGRDDEEIERRLAALEECLRGEKIKRLSSQTPYALRKLPGIVPQKTPYALRNLPR